MALENLCTRSPRVTAQCATLETWLDLVTSTMLMASKAGVLRGGISALLCTSRYRNVPFILYEFNFNTVGSF